MSNRRILGFALLAASVAFWLVLRGLFDWALGLVGLVNPPILSVFPAGDLAAVVVAGAIGVALWKAPKSHAFLIDVVDEMSKVVWPTRQETQDSTLVVMVTVVVVSLVLWAFDLVWIELSNLILYSA